MPLDKGFYGENLAEQQRKNTAEQQAPGVTGVQSLGGGSSGAGDAVGGGAAVPAAALAQAQAPKFVGVKRLLEANKDSTFGKDVAKNVAGKVAAFGDKVGAATRTAVKGATSKVVLPTEAEVSELSTITDPSKKVNILDAGTFGRLQEAGKRFSTAAHAGPGGVTVDSDGTLSTEATKLAALGQQSGTDLLTSLYGKGGGTRGRGFSALLAHATGGAEIADASKGAVGAGGVLTDANRKAAGEVGTDATFKAGQARGAYDKVLNDVTKYMTDLGIEDPAGHATGLLTGAYNVDQLRGRINDTKAALVAKSKAASEKEFAQSLQQQAEAQAMGYGLSDAERAALNTQNAVTGTSLLKTSGNVTNYKDTSDYQKIKNSVLTMEQKSGLAAPAELNPASIEKYMVDAANAIITKATAPKGDPEAKAKKRAELDAEWKRRQESFEKGVSGGEFDSGLSIGSKVGTSLANIFTLGAGSAAAAADAPRRNTEAAHRYAKAYYHAYNKAPDRATLIAATKIDGDAYNNEINEAITMAGTTS